MDVVIVQMARIGFAERGVKLKTTLGSCVGVVLHDRLRSRSGMAHIMLPERLREDEAASKYADTAIPALLAQLEERGSRRGDLCAYVAGGATMFRASLDRRITTIGERNLAAVHAILGGLGIPIEREDTGGERGRTVVFDSETGGMEVRTLQPMAASGARA